MGIEAEDVFNDRDRSVRSTQGQIGVTKPGPNAGVFGIERHGALGLCPGGCRIPKGKINVAEQQVQARVLAPALQGLLDHCLRAL